MAEPADVQAHWTRPSVLARIDAALTELGHDPQNLNPEILATLEHLHSGGSAITRDQAKRVSITEDSRVLDVGCGIGGPARYLAHTYDCRVDGIDLTPELVETGRVLTERCKLTDRVGLQVGNALELAIPGRQCNAHGIGGRREHNRHATACLKQRRHARAAGGQDHIRRKRDQFSRISANKS